MARKKQSIPVRSIPREAGNGIAVARISSEVFRADDVATHSHRHEYHFFVLQEKGISHTEVDFERYYITEPSIIYQAPRQVHRALEVQDLEMYMLVINEENIHREYLQVLQTITPAKPLAVGPADLELLRNGFSLSLEIFSRPEAPFYAAQLRDSCNTLVAMFISRYLGQLENEPAASRFHAIEQSFSILLESNFHRLKRPAEYAEQLNISVAYLNECVKSVTGFSATHQIRHRIVLEAKRLLFHSDKSVKEIAAELGYRDYAYFSRLFADIAGSPALAFRNKNRG